MQIQRRYTVGDRERKNKNLELKVSSISSLVHRYRGDVNPTYESSWFEDNWTVGSEK